jgi:solute carrier family 45 protein 1/2/4
VVFQFHEEGDMSAKETADKQIRGLGTDIALVSSMVFVAQFVLSSVIGTIVHSMQSTVAVPICASVLSFLGAITATQVVYLGL